MVMYKPYFGDIIVVGGTKWEDNEDKIDSR